MKVLETDRLVLRWLCAGDAAFILRLINEPSWLQFIGDRGVRTLADARAYIFKGPVEMYHRAGFGLYLTELKDTGVPIGICGPIKRDDLKDVDLGCALLPEFWGRGYSHEAASAVMVFAQNTLRLKRIVAITSPANHSSIRLLGKLGFVFECNVRRSETGPETCLFAHRFRHADASQRGRRIWRRASSSGCAARIGDVARNSSATAFRPRARRLA